MSPSTGATAATRAAEIHGGRKLRPDQGGVQLPAGAVPFVSILYRLAVDRNL